ncbi:ABC transporter ATP-binding protein [Paenibacillus sp. CGMCC 1.16610]|uniref:ATP-binding cassette domain-containing protein n=1 Tax=Paenibacillus anseongense TaxID=2682845 RepID=A0ABW9UIE9_9BACL|nr:ABC transporter ATP-binding protein [Paenibacillus sp. CGMCC 1.16610]MVQ39281.1 ATP-binding cassette domain-containing protein [Paenibacillus anseongense]
MIRFEQVSKKYSERTYALQGVDLHIEKGEFFVLIGPSGSGKTTMLKMVNRLIEPTSGEIFLNNKSIRDYNIHELRCNIGYVLQSIALFPHMTIEKNISIVPELRGWSAKAIHIRVNELLEMVGLDPLTYRNRRPAELSGGQQQRVGVVRALAANPDIVLMDEPFSALDPISRDQLQQDLVVLKKTISKTILFVTHDIQEAVLLGDRICLMQAGNVVQVGSAKELIENPVTSFVKEFVGSNLDNGCREEGLNK